MRIKELYIENFGGLSDRRLAFKDGVNLITGDNESGKSTVASFISYIFYGFADRTARRLLSDIKTGISAGSLVFETDDGAEYLISRRDGEGAKAASVQVRNASGEIFDGWRDSGSPGDFFMGIPQGLFVRSAFVSQRYGAEQAGDSVEAVRNLLISGSEATDLRRALKKLEDMRVELLHKNGKGGKLFVADNQILECENATQDALSALKNAENARLELDKRKRELEKTDGDIERVKGDIEAIRISALVDLLREKNDLENRRAETEERLRDLDREYSHNGFIPDREYSKKLLEAENVKRRAATECELACARAEKLGGSALTHVRGKGGFDSFEARLGALSKTERLCLLCGAASALLAVGALIFGILFAVLASVGGGASVAAMSLAFVAAAVVSFRKKADAEREIQRFTAPLGNFGAAITPREITDAIRLLKENQTDIDENVRLASEAEGKRVEVDEAVADLLRRWGMVYADKAVERADLYFDKKDKLCAFAEALEEKLRLCAVRLSVYSEEEKRKAARANVKKSLGTSEEQLTVQLAQLEAREKALLEEYNALRVQYARDYSALPSVEKLTEKREQLVKERDEYLRRYRAVTLALDTLKSSDDELRRTVTPYLAEKAGRLFGEMTASKYQGLGIDGESGGISLTFKTDSGFFSSEYLSAGSADLAWLCLRLAMHSRISGAERLPLILDECFVCFDETRLSRMLRLLNSMAGGGTQVFLFSANRREEECLKKQGIPFGAIRM